jgi:hypothetical protein
MTNRLPYLVGVFGLLVTSIFVYSFNPGFAGSSADSILFSNQFQSTNLFDFGPLDKYHVATSPVYVAIIGTFVKFSPLTVKFILHGTYYVFAILTIVVFCKLSQSINQKIGIPLVFLFSTSGYLAAPTIFPTSDLPAILFLLLTFFAHSKKQNLAFSLAVFMMVSARQSLAWLIVYFFILDLISEKGLKLRIFPKYFLGVFSLLVTYIYFGYRLAPPVYEESQPLNIFSVPNFYSTIQIVFVLAICLISILPLLNFRIAVKTLFKNRLGLLFLLALSSTPFLAYLTDPHVKFVEGMGWISLLTLKFGFSSLQLSLISFLLLLSFLVFLFQKMDLSDPKSLLLFFMFFASSLLLPIPFLRYFEMQGIILFSLVFIKGINFKHHLRLHHALLASFLTVFLNLSKVLN